jgi:hypothetical protein
MKVEEYECVKIKRRAQPRIYEQTKDLTPEQLVAHYQRVGETVRARQGRLRAAVEPDARLREGSASDIPRK